MQSHSASADSTVNPTNIDFEIEIVHADGIRLLFFLEAETSVRRHFWAALSQVNLLDHISTYHVLYRHAH